MLRWPIMKKTNHPKTFPVTNQGDGTSRRQEPLFWAGLLWWWKRWSENNSHEEVWRNLWQQTMTSPSNLLVWFWWLYVYVFVARGQWFVDTARNLCIQQFGSNADQRTDKKLLSSLFFLCIFVCYCSIKVVYSINGGCSLGSLFFHFVSSIVGLYCVLCSEMWWRIVNSLGLLPLQLSHRSMPVNTLKLLRKENKSCLSRFC